MRFVIDNLTFERHDQPLFSGIHCTLYAGELLQVRGTNGSGKSTLLRILAGFIAPQEGEVRWQNAPVSQQNLHYMGHQNGIKQNLTVIENIKLYCALAMLKKNNDELDHVMQKINLHHAMHTPAAQLSAGQLRRLSLAKLVLNPTALWILDEPTTALDAEGNTFVTELLTQHLENDGIAIIATHQDITVKCPTKTLWLGKI